jgi:hypothetical protein
VPFEKKAVGVRSAFLAALLAFTISGCGGNGGKVSNVSDATSSAGKDGPTEIVSGYLQDVQGGAWPAVVGFYDPKVFAIVRPNAIVAMLGASLRPVLLRTGEPKFRTQSSAAGTLVLVTMKGTGGYSVVNSYFLRHTAAGWKIGYDSVVGDTLAKYVAARIQDRSGLSSAKGPSSAAVAAGDAAVRRYRRLFFPDGV